MKYLLFLALLFFTQVAISQSNDSIHLIDYLSGDHIYDVTIEGNTTTTMYLHFDTPEIPDYGAIYNRIARVSGWYMNEKSEKIHLMGVLWSPEYLTLYAPASQEKPEKCQLLVQGYDSVVFKENQKPIEIIETFTLGVKSSSWTKNGISKQVEGINFQEKNLSRTILIRMRDNMGRLNTINLFEVLMNQVGNSNTDLIGMNGYADMSIELLEHSSTSSGMNVLFAIMEDGSCNTDRRSLLYISLNQSFVLGDFGTIEIENCNDFFSIPDKDGKTFHIVPVGDKHSSSSQELGSYQIVESKIEIIKSWD